MGEAKLSLSESRRVGCGGCGGSLVGMVEVVWGSAGAPLLCTLEDAERRAMFGVAGDGYF